MFTEQFAHPARSRAIQVRSTLTGDWHDGFEISDVVMGPDGVVGYHLRRISDQAVMPHVFTATDVRGVEELPFWPSSIGTSEVGG